ncbi:hypothetical protein BDW62DRAFT_203178 [Aspergillus aurantiobrunneus]
MSYKTQIELTLTGSILSKHDDCPPETVSVLADNSTTKTITEKINFRLRQKKTVPPDSKAFFSYDDVVLRFRPGNPTLSDLYKYLMSIKPGGSVKRKCMLEVDYVQSGFRDDVFLITGASVIGC